MTHSHFMPHGWCLMWDSRLVFLHIVGNACTALAYLSIPAQLLYFWSKRKDLLGPVNGTLLGFAAFILTCGFGHAVKIWTLWNPDYWFQGWVDMTVGVMSSVTALGLLPALAVLLSSESPTALRARIARLEAARLPEPEQILASSNLPPREPLPDITSIMRKLDGLELQLAMREGAFQHAHDPMVLTMASLDPQKVVVALANRAYCDLVGFAADDLAGKPAAQTLAGPRTDLEEWKRTNEATMRGESCIGRGILYLSRGPTMVEWSSAPVPLSADRDEPYGCAISTLRVIGCA